MKGNWTLEVDREGQGEKHEKGKWGAGLGTFYLVAQLTWEGRQVLCDDLECQSEGLEYHSLGLLVQFPSFINESEKRKSGQGKPSGAVISFGRQASDPSSQHSAPSSRVEGR